MTIATGPKSPAPRVGRSYAWQLETAATALLATVGLLAEYGFYTPLMDDRHCQALRLAAVILFLARQVADARRCSKTVHWVGRCWLEVAALPAAAIAAGTVGAPVLATAITAGAIYVAVRQTSLWALAMLDRALRPATGLARGWQSIHPMISSYLLMVILGGALLALPAATASDHRNAPYTHLLNSLFMAGSAATGTGLSVYDFPAEYTLFGRIVVLVLMQAAGLAAMIFGTVFGLTVTRSLWPKESFRAGAPDMPRLVRIVKAIVLVSFSLEALGAVLLYPLWSQEPGVLGRVFRSVFLAVGAFCNTGLSLERNSLVDMGGFWQVYGVVMPLIVLGGLGFPVLYEAAFRLGGAGRRLTQAAWPLSPDRWSLHTRLVLSVTLCLLVIGTAGLAFFETPWRHGGFWYVGRSNMLSADDSIQTSLQTMRGHSGDQRLYDALFQSASVRTAGLKTVLVKPGAISPASLTLMMGLMLIGGSPGSAAGGFHTVALAILVAAIVSSFRRRSQPTIMGAVIPDNAVRRVFAVFFAGLGWLMLTILVLAHMQRTDFLTLTFEAVSAFSTNGLSLGLTQSLTAVSKVMLLLTMLAGRVGPLALMVAMLGHEGSQPSGTVAEPVIVA